MGCSDSKLDALEAVSLCRGRSDLLADAIRHRYALAEAHAAYAASLRSVGASLHAGLLAAAADPSASPVLQLPIQRKGDDPPPTVPAHNPHSRSHSGSHIQFHPSDDDSYYSGSDSVSPFHSGGSSPIHNHPTANIHYARGKPPPSSVSFEQQRPQSSETVQFGSVEPSSFYPYYNPPYAPQNPYYSNYNFANAAQNSNYSDSVPYQPNYYGYGGMGGFFGSSSPPPAVIPPPARAGMDDSSAASKVLPPPPSPPRTSGWDFLNPFELQETYYPPYTPSRSSREVREEEGIPELEELEQEVVKEAYDNLKSMPSTSGAMPEEYSSKKPSSQKNNRVSNYGGSSRYMSRPAGDAIGSKDVENVVEKSVAHEERRSMAVPTASRINPDVSVAVGELKVQFDRASESAIEISRLLEVGKYQYAQKKSVHEATSRMMRVMTPPSSSNCGDLLNFDEDIVMNSRSLSSTLQKLYIWEKKLYEEVRAEEKMRLLHDKSCKRLKQLDEKGAEAYKIDSTRTLISKLSSKIRIAIKVVESISNKINKLRDEELCHQVNELILGRFTRMWQVMLECHRNQCLAISEAKGLDSLVNMGKPSDTHMDAVMQLELELLRWISNFSDWINAQKSFIKTLNGWLVLCLHYEPEVTADGIPPYSPGRLGAPRIFVICNQWSQAMDRISEREVVDTMRSFASSVRSLWEQNDAEQRQIIMASRDAERWLKTREREQHTFHKELDALNKKLVLVPGQNGPHNGAEVGSSLQLGLKHIFEAMENFTDSSMRAYEEVRLHSEEERVDRESG